MTATMTHTTTTAMTKSVARTPMEADWVPVYPEPELAGTEPPELEVEPEVGPEVGPPQTTVVGAVRTASTPPTHPSPATRR